MPLPIDWIQIPVDGKYLQNDGLGSPEVGSITFRSLQSVVVDGVQVSPANIVATLDTTGSFSTALGSTNSPLIVPSGSWPWLVTFDFESGNGPDPFWFNVPYDSPPINLPTVRVVIPGPAPTPMPSGPPGPPNILAIGTVTTVAVGNPATAGITGSSPAQALNLGIPVGATGAAGGTGPAGNGVLTTVGAPGAGLGNNGDYAYDYTATTMYGPKAAGAWPAGMKFAPTFGDFSVASNFQRCITNISAPDTRYDVAVVGSNLQEDLRQAAILILGARMQNIFQRPLRIYSVQGSFDAGGSAVVANSGVALGFDPGVATGANVLFDPAASGWVWRSDGNVVPYNFYTGLSDPATTFTLNSGALTAYGAADIVREELTANQDNVTGTLRGYKNGTLMWTGTVAAIPAGRLVAGFRGIGTSGAYPLAQRFLFTSVSTTDQTLQNVTNVSTPPLTNFVLNIPGRVRMQIASASTPTVAARQRVFPPGFSWLPYGPLLVNGPGDVVCVSGAMNAVWQRYPGIRAGGVGYVSPTGNNGTAVVGDPTHPFLTWNAALQSSAQIIGFQPGRHLPCDWRYTSPGAGAMKMCIAIIPGTVVIRNAGDDISIAGGWTAVGGFAGMYQRTIANAAGQAAWNAFAPHCVRMLDQRDSDFYPDRIQNFPTITNDATGVTNAKAALFAVGTGWVWDGALGNKILYAMRGGTNLSVTSQLEALYLDGSGTDRCFLLGANIATMGMYFDGPGFVVSEGAGSIPSSAWIEDGWIINSPNYGIEADSNSLIVVSRTDIHASISDGINGDSTRNGSGAVTNGLVSGCTITAAGDVATQGTSVSTNRQAISWHAGNIAGFANVYKGSWGQQRADTASGSGPQNTWEVGSCAILGDARLGAGQTGFGFYAGAGSGRNVWLDSCVGSGNNLYPLYIQDAGGLHVITKTFNCAFDQAPVMVGGAAAPVAYTPDAP